MDKHEMPENMEELKEVLCEWLGMSWNDILALLIAPLWAFYIRFEKQAAKSEQPAFLQEGEKP
jgi:hypothetical protein